MLVSGGSCGGSERGVCPHEVGVQQAWAVGVIVEPAGRGHPGQWHLLEQRMGPRGALLMPPRASAAATRVQGGGSFVCHVDACSGTASL